MLGELWEGLLNLLFPPICTLCKKYLPPFDRPFQICQECRRLAEPNHPPFCRKCSRPLKNVNRIFCRTCEGASHHFDKAHAVWAYTPTTQKLIHLLKYKGKTGLRRYFAHCMKIFLETYPVDFSSIDLIVPIPLHGARYRERGFNQAELLAQTLSELLKIPLSSRILIRRRATPNQASLTEKERWTNISGAFTIKQLKSIRGKNILLVDDLLTTGSTTSEAAGVLKAFGAQSVQVFTLAIARLEKEWE